MKRRKKRIKRKKAPFQACGISSLKETIDHARTESTLGRGSASGANPFEKLCFNLYFPMSKSEDMQPDQLEIERLCFRKS